ncbi:MAG: vitamin K epoxide reductase family protein [Acidimicrobiia bacterium]
MIELERSRPTTRRRFAGLACLLAAFVLAAPPSGAQEPEPVVRVVLYFSPTCGHCHFVIDEVLPGIFEENGGEPQVFYDEALPAGEVAFILLDNGTLQVLLVDVTTEAGGAFFHAASSVFAIESQGVPRLIVGDEVMIGSVEIPERLPAIMADSLEAGTTIDWPEIVGIEAAVAAAVPARDESTTTTVDSESTTIGPPVTIPAAQPPSAWDRFRQDPAGNTVSLVVLVAMLGVLVAVGVRLRKAPVAAVPGRAIPLLALVGVGIAGYLAFVEIGGAEAVCGPVGDCNTVQQSDYARLFGVLPIGVAGVVGYAIVLAVWAAAKTASGRLADIASMALLGGAVIGTVFSVYLTFLEPFVIGATCMWCIASAVVITAILWSSVAPARFAASRWMPAP